jgi:hypothetical protein
MSNCDTPSETRAVSFWAWFQVADLSALKTFIQDSRAAPCLCEMLSDTVYALPWIWCQHPTNVRRDNLLVRVCGNGHWRPADIGYLFLDKPYPVVMVIPLTEIDRDDKIYHQSAYPFTIPLHAAASARGITKLCQNLDTSLRGEAPAARGQ